MSTLSANHLFIGGSRDGQWVEVLADRLAVELPLPGPRLKGPQPSEFYQRMQFNGETESYHVFAFKGLSGNTVMRALLEFYRPAPTLPPPAIKLPEKPGAKARLRQAAPK